MAEGEEGRKKSEKEKLLEEPPSELLPTALNPGLRRKRQIQVGFECEFIDSPKELQTECPICLHILREPYQATCCGYIYCHSCIERVKETSKPCPACNRPEFDIFPDKGLHKSLYGFKVWCDNRNKYGCNWSGELRDLTPHLNQNPSHEKRFTGCDFVEVQCNLCQEFVLRINLQVHEENLCQCRNYTCEFCKKANGRYKDIVDTHQMECPFQPLPCPNECGLNIERQNMEHHMKNECSKRPPDKIPCEFNFAGCCAMIPPDEMEDHLQECVGTHLSLVATSHLSLRERLIQLQGHFDENNRYIEKLQKEKREMQEQFQREVQAIREMRHEFDLLRQQQEVDRGSIETLRRYSGVLPIIFTLDDYEGRKVRGDMGWSSSPFYTHFQGYRMSLWVDIGGNGPGKGIYISVFLSLMKGEFDAKLKWPFRGSIIIQLLSQQSLEEPPHAEVIRYHDHTPNATAGRVMEEGRMSKPWGKGKFMRHDELKAGGYIHNDTLKFRVKLANS